MNAVVKEVTTEAQSKAIEFPQQSLVAWFSNQIKVAWGPGLSHTFNGLDSLEVAMCNISNIKLLDPIHKRRLVESVRSHLGLAPRKIEVPKLSLV